MKEQIRLVWRKIDELIPYAKNAKLHPQEQLTGKKAVLLDGQG